MEAKSMMEPKPQAQIAAFEARKRVNELRKNLKNSIRGHLLNKEHSFIKEVLKNMTEHDTITSDAERYILECFENAIVNTTNMACKIAISRKSPTLDKKDMDFAIHLQMVRRIKKNPNINSSNQHMMPPYYSPEMEEIFSGAKEPKQEHLENIALLEKFQREKREKNNL